MFNKIFYLQLDGRPINHADNPIFMNISGTGAVIESKMYETFHTATGLSNPTANTVRKSASTNFMDDPAQRESEPKTMDHAASVTEKHYDLGGVGRKVTNVIFTNLMRQNRCFRFKANSGWTRRVKGQH